MQDCCSAFALQLLCALHAGAALNSTICVIGVCPWLRAGHKEAADLAIAGEQLEEDAAIDDVLQRCEAISAELRTLLGEQRLTDRRAMSIPVPLAWTGPVSSS